MTVKPHLLSLLLCSDCMIGAARHVAQAWLAQKGAPLQYVRAHAAAAAAAAQPAASHSPKFDESLPLNAQAASPEASKAREPSPLEAELDPRKTQQVKTQTSTLKMKKARSAAAKHAADDYADDGAFQWEDSTHPRQRRAERDHFKASAATTSSAAGAPFKMHAMLPKLSGGRRGDPELAHFRGSKLQQQAKDTNYMLGHPIWTEEEKNSVEIQHRKCETISDYLAYSAVQLLRFNFDLFSGYYFGNMDESRWLTRIVFLETVAGVPGMVGAMIRHLHSLRLMRRDYGWIHTLLEEAENERMHLLTAMKLKKPSRLFRASVLVTQGLFVNLWFFAYLASPRFCHRFVGYLEEEAVVTYTKCLKQLDSNKLPIFSHLAAPPIAKKYWRLPEDAKMRDVLLSIRADESHHRDVNHALASRNPLDPNPFEAGK